MVKSEFFQAAGLKLFEFGFGTCKAKPRHVTQASGANPTNADATEGALQKQPTRREAQGARKLY